jgi:hypothetical protein
LLDLVWDVFKDCSTAVGILGLLLKMSSIRILRLRVETTPLKADEEGSLALQESWPLSELRDLQEELVLLEAGVS